MAFLIPFIPAIIGAGGAIGAADIAASGQQSAAQQQANATTQAAQIQAQTQQEALLFAAQQAQQSLISQNAIQKANYNQWAAQQQRVGQFLQTLGYPARSIPPYEAIPGAANPVPTSLAQAGIGTGSTPALTSTGAPANTALPPATTTPTSAPTTPSSPTTATGAGSYQGLINAINQGQSPQAAIAQFNQSQNLPYGSSYAWRSIANAPGGGVVELPNGQYLTPSPQGVWGVAGSPSGGATSSTASLTNSPTANAMAGTTGNSFLDYMLAQQLASGTPTQATMPTSNQWTFPAFG